MTLKSKLAASAVAAALLLALVVVWATRGRDAGTPRGPDAVPNVAAAAPAETADAAGAPPPPVAAAPAATPAGPTGTVRVRVVDAETGEPIPGVAVRRCRLEGNLAFFGGDDDDRAFWVSDAIETARPGDRAFTDADGISSQSVPPGPWVVLVRHPRYRDFVGPRFPVRTGDAREFEIRLVPFPPGEREVVFSGTVTDGVTTDPLEGVRVTGSWREGPAVRTVDAVTAADGGYSLTIPVNAPVEIHFAKHGYEERPILADPLLMPWIGGDAVMAPVDGGPRRGEGRLDGRVVDLATGKPVAGVQVTLERGLGPEGGGGIGSWGEWRSDEAGRFRIDLAPVDGRDERVAIVVRRDGYAEHVSDPVVLSPDRTTPVVVALAPARGPAGISGRVIEAGTGRPIAGARVVTEEVFGDPLAATTTDAAGRFELPAFGDVDIVRATADGHGPATAKPGRDLELELVRADAVLRGTVVDARSRRPLAGAMVTLFTAPEGFGPGPLTVTDERGEYELKVPPGAYFVRARLEGYGPAVSRATEAASKSGTTVDLAMVAADASVRGTARNASTGEALSEAAEDIRILRLGAEGDEPEGIESRLDDYDGGIRVDVDGAAYACSLTPGRYLLVVNLGGYLPVREEFVLAAGETRTLDLDVEPVPPLVAMVRGVVRRAGTGEALADVDVRLRYRGARLGWTRTDADGRFELRAPAGECVVEATATIGREPVTREAKAAPTAGETVEVEIAIGP